MGGSHGHSSTYQTTNQQTTQNVQQTTNQTQNTSTVNNINNEKLANIANTCIGPGASMTYEANLSQFQQASNTINIVGDSNVVSQVNQNLTAAFQGINLEQGKLDCMQEAIVDFGETDADQTSETQGGAASSESDGSQESSQKSSAEASASASACKSGGLISVAGCAGAGSSGGGITKIIVLIVIVAVVGGIIYMLTSKSKSNSNSNQQYY